MKYIIIDTETTGTTPQHGVIQIAGSLYCGGHWYPFNHRCAPFASDLIADEALAVNGTNREEIRAFRSPHEVYGEFINMLAGCVDKYAPKDKLVWVGYNADFDMTMLRSWFAKCGETKYFGSWFWFPPVDVMGIAMHFLQGRRAELVNFKLGTVAAFLDVPIPENLHDAGADIRLTWDLYKRLQGCKAPDLPIRDP